MPPTPRWMMLTATSCCGSFAISSSIASSEPATSALTTRLSSLTAPSWASLKTSSSDTLRPERRASASVFRRFARSPASWRARRSFSTTRTYSPASRHAVEAEHLDRLAGRARASRARPMKSCIARTRPKCAPATSASPTRSVPRWIRMRHDRAAAGVELGLDHGARRVRVAVGPAAPRGRSRPGSCRAASPGPRASSR